MRTERLDRNAEGYADPTPGAVLKRIDKEERAQAYAEEGERLNRISSLKNSTKRSTRRNTRGGDISSTDFTTSQTSQTRRKTRL